MDNNTRYFSKIVGSLCVLTLSLYYYLNIFSLDFLIGIDSYYYALQADWWALTGKVKIIDSSILHRLSGLLTLLGLKSETSVKGLWFILHLIFVIAVNLNKMAQAQRLLINLLLLFSVSFYYGVIEFPKMYSYLLLLSIWGYYFFEKKRYLLSMAILSLSLFLHKSSLPFVVGLIPLNIFELIKGRVQFKTIIKILGLIGLLLSLYLLFVSDHLHISDLKRLGTLNFVPGLITLILMTKISFIIKIEICLYFLGFIFLSYQLIKKKEYTYLYFLLCLVLPSLVPFGSHEVMGVGQRYSILLPSLSLVFLSLYKLNLPHHKKSLFFCALFFIAPLINLTKIGHKFDFQGYYLDYDTITKELIQYNIPMLIAHRGFNFFYKQRTKKESFLFMPEDHWPKQKIWRLAYGVKKEQYQYFLSGKCSYQSGMIKNLYHPYYSLIREDCWELLRLAVLEKDDEELFEYLNNSSFNPHKKRPSFLYRKHNKTNKEEGEFSALPL